MKSSLLFIVAVITAFGQGQGKGAPRSARQAAPVDFTGTWVSPVMEDWRWRMVTPLKGDAASVPINGEGRKIVEAWDPAKDEAAGLQCKSYGAPALLRIPGRLRISWQDDSTLKLEADAGTQTRLLHFGAAAPAGTQATWQGYSVARWDPGSGTGTGGVNIPLGLSARVGTRSRTLEVTTTLLRDGYLRKNGVPYSNRTTLTEYFDRFTEANGDEWFTVTTVVNDPVYLAIPFVTTTDFRREPDDSRFRASACSAR